MNLRKIPIIILIFIIMCNLVVSQTNLTQKDALSAIAKSKNDIKTMSEDGFGIVYVNDTLFAAEESFKRAKNAIKLGYKEFNYNEVIELTSKISETMNKSYELSDRIRAFSLQSEEYAKAEVNTSKSRELLIYAKEALANERYPEADDFINKAESMLEIEKAELSLGKAVTRATRSFFEKNWQQIIGFVLFVIITTIITWRRIRIFLLKRNLSDLKLEQEAIIHLIKKTQVERFDIGQISPLTYQIRMKVYKGRLVQIKHTIPVIESMLPKKRTSNVNEIERKPVNKQEPINPQLPIP